MENSILSPDVGLPVPLAHQLKSQLASHVQTTMQSKGLAQAQLAEMTGLDQPRVSKLLRGQIDDFSVTRLQEVLSKLGQSVQIMASSGWDGPVTFTVHVAPKIYSAGIGILPEEDGSTISNPTITKLVFTRRQIKRLYAAIGTEIERYGQDLDALEIIFTNAADGKEMFDLHEVNFQSQASSKFSAFGTGMPDDDED